MNIIESLQNQLIVSCQAGPDEPLHGPTYMAAMAQAAAAGGAGAIRASGAADISAICETVSLPVIGIDKVHHAGSEVFITPDWDAAARIVAAGAHMVALDGTTRPRPGGAELKGLITAIHEQLRVPVMADCSCMEDAKAAIDAGADVLATTLSGYTSHGRRPCAGPDLEFVRDLARSFVQPVIAEGRFEHPSQVAQAFSYGAAAVVVGSAITRPQLITQRFVAASQRLMGGQQYASAIQVVLNKIIAEEQSSFAAAAEAITKTIRTGGLLYLFGTGHSHALAEEGHYRAGGLAPAVPILASGLMLHESASASTYLERTPGVAAAILARYAPQPGDSLIVFSNSGVNAAPVEMARLARDKGLTVIAVQSTAYAAQAPKGSTGESLADLADIVIDNHLPPGDALVSLNDTGLSTGPGSTVLGAFILNSLLSEVINRLVQLDGDAPIYISANMPGAFEHNEDLIRHYSGRNPHL